MSRPRLHLPVQALVCVAAFGFGLPLAIALFPQTSEVRICSSFTVLITMLCMECQTYAAMFTLQYADVLSRIWTVKVSSSPLLLFENSPWSSRTISDFYYPIKRQHEHSRARRKVWRQYDVKLPSNGGENWETMFLWEIWCEHFPVELCSLILLFQVSPSDLEPEIQMKTKETKLHYNKGLWNNRLITRFESMYFEEMWARSIIFLTR